jgi:hypothetical protein
MQCSEFVDQVEYRLGPDISRLPGRVLYCGLSAFRDGQLYVMGLNPGGDPSSHDSILDDLQGTRPDDYSAYLCEVWPRYAAGRAPHQRRVAEVCGLLGHEDMRRVFSTNAIFAGTKRAADITTLDALYGLSAKCWPVQKWFLSIVRPRTIVCLGNGALSSFGLLAGWLKMSRDAIASCGPSRSFRDGKWFDAQIHLEGVVPSSKVRVIGIPHPSRFGLSQALCRFLVRERERTLSARGDDAR